jgi:integrase
MSELPLSEITGAQIRSFLLKISEDGFLKPNFRISNSTRTRVKALLSVIFSDALNEEPPLVKFNPVLGLKIKEQRMGTKKPKVLADSDECLRFIETAKKIDSFHFTVACVFLMSGLRKQELIALKWSSVNFKTRQFHISQRYVQASNSVEGGTKRGVYATRDVPVPENLISILAAHKKATKFNAPSDFVFTKPSGNFYGPREIWVVIKRIAKASKIDTHPHALRHTYGREFAVNTGNIKALQAILGHASSTTTDIYSELSGNRLKGFGESVSFDVDVKRSGE